ncbi:unnamed protein product, partial [Mesorhabditis spiculigera]
MKMSKDHDAPKNYWMNGEEQAYSTWGDPWEIPSFFCTLLSPNGIMLHQWCQARLMHGICKRPFGTKTPSLKEPNCEDGWTGSRHTGKCYKLTGNKTNSMGFQETCLNWNGKGASVTSYLEKEFIIELAESNGFNSVWLGAKRGSNGRFAWLDGNKFDGAYWSADGPSTSGNDKNCLVLYSLHFDHLDSRHRWRLIFLGVAAMVFAADECEEGWLLKRGSKSCYKIMDGTTFWDSEFKCAQLGGHLTSVLSDEENQALLDLITNENEGMMVWVGALAYSRKAGPRVNHWMDGSEAKFGNWDPAPDYQSEKYCGTMLPSGKLQMSVCHQHKKGLCKRAIGQEAPTFTKPACEVGWSGCPLTGFCYKTTNGRSNSGAAQEYCLSQDANLASVTSFLENEAVLRTAQEDGFKKVWLGAKKVAMGPWTWSDGTPWDVEFWNPTTSWNQTTNCVGSYTESTDAAKPDDREVHRWHALDCDAKDLVGVCKKAPGSSPSKETKA